MLRTDGPGRDEHHIGLGAQHRKERLIGRAAEAAGQAPDGGGSVNAGNHIEPHSWPGRGWRQIAVQHGRVNRVTGKRQELPHRHTSGER